MKLYSNSSNAFKGYDIRPFKGFFMGSNTHNLAKEIQNIGKKEGFKIFSKQKVGSDVICAEANLDKMPSSNVELWAQDVWTFCKGKLFSNWKVKDNITMSKFFNMEYINEEEHIPGGNFFIVDNNGKDDMFIGASSLKSFILKSFTIQKLKKMFGVNKVYTLPQMDYHIDLFIRPLDEKRILVADDEMTLNILKKGQKEFKKYVKTKGLEDTPFALCILKRFQKEIDAFRASIFHNTLPQTDTIVNIIKNSGFEPIRVPGRIYSVSDFGGNDLFLSHDCNYLNAIVTKNNDGDNVYITGKSCIDKNLGLNSPFVKDFDFRFEKEFVKSIEPYIKPDKIYFVDTYDQFVSMEMLKERQGGIHCVCAEIPEDKGKL